MPLVDNRCTRGPSPRSSAFQPDLLNPLAPAEDRDRTISRRSNSHSRTALNGEQPYPWDRLPAQDAMSRHRGANLAVDVGLWQDQPVIPGVPFIPLSDGHSTGRRITRTCFRTCSAPSTCSQAGLHSWALRTVADRPEPTFARLTLLFGEATAPVKLPAWHGPRPDIRRRVSRGTREGEVFRGSSMGLAPWFHCLLPIPCTRRANGVMPSCSEGSRVFPSFRR